MTDEPDLRSAVGVTEWARDLRDCERNPFIRGAQWDELAPILEAQTEAVARAMRMKDAWVLHRNTLKHIGEPSRFNAINRETMSKAIRAFCWAMERAERGE